VRATRALLRDDAGLRSILDKVVLRQDKAVPPAVATVCLNELACTIGDQLLVTRSEDEPVLRWRFNVRR
jgi:hypothetical protein